MNDLALIQKSLETDLINAGVQTVLPDHVKMSSFVRCAAIAMVQGKDLAEADKDSVIMSLTKCATDGLVPDGKEAAMVVYNTNVGTKQQPDWRKMAQYLPMIDGVLKRARMSGQIDSMAAKAVYENDSFDYWLDEDGEHIQYRPTWKTRGPFKLAFAFAKLKTGDLVVEVMTKEDIDKVRASSKTGKFGPWADWYDRMACKTVFHRLARRLPNSSEIVEMCEAGMNMKFERDMGEVLMTGDKSETAQGLLESTEKPAKKTTSKKAEKAEQESAQVGENKIDMSAFLKQSIDSCTTLDDLKQCGDDIKVRIDDDELSEFQIKEVRNHLDAAMKTMKNPG